MTDGLRSLEKLRAEMVSQAKAALAQQRTALAQAEQRVVESAARLAEVSLRAQAHSGAELDTVADLAWAERSQRAHRVQQSQWEARLAAAQAQRVQVQTQVAHAERQMREAELGRRAVGHVVAQHDAARAHKHELRVEEDAADAHRTRPR